MFERYDEPARRSLFFARYEASALGSRTIDTEHLLLDLLEERLPLLADLLRHSNVTPDAIRERTYARFNTGAPPIDVAIEIPFSAAAKRVIEYTGEESLRLLHRHIGPEHMLLGLLRLEEGHAWEILKEFGLTVTSVREALVMHVGAGSSTSSGPIYMLSAIDGPSPGRRAANACDITLQDQYDTVEALSVALREQLGLELTSSVS